jgi:hypothetical protein
MLLRPADVVLDPVEIDGYDRRIKLGDGGHGVPLLRLVAARGSERVAWQRRIGCGARLRLAHIMTAQWPTGQPGASGVSGDALVRPTGPAAAVNDLGCRDATK